MLNSRPIAYNKTDELYEEVLTPGHFLIGRNRTSITEPPKPQSITAMRTFDDLRDFWRLWSEDYFNQLRTRTKWTNPQPNLVEGQIVILKNQSSSDPCQWNLAKVVTCFTDASNLVRTVVVRVNGVEKGILSIQAIPLPESSLRHIWNRIYLNCSRGESVRLEVSFFRSSQKETLPGPGGAIQNVVPHYDIS